MSKTTTETAIRSTTSNTALKAKKDPARSKDPAMNLAVPPFTNRTSSVRNSKHLSLSSLAMTAENASVDIEISRTHAARESSSRLSETPINDFEIRILQSPLDRPRERFSPPFKEEEAEALLHTWDGLILPSKTLMPQKGDCRKLFDQKVPDVLRDRLFTQEDLEKFFTISDTRKAESARAKCRELLAKKVGEILYRALFVGKVGETLHRCRELPHASSGLRIRLSFGDQADYLPEIIGLPWELLYSPKDGVFLGHQSDLEIVRHLDTETHFPSLAVDPPIRILVVFCAPQDQTSIDYPGQKMRLQRKLMKYRNIEPRFLEKATLTTLGERLKEVDPHVIHFLGHGSFRRGSGEGILFFEDERNNTRTVISAEFLAHLKRSLSLRLVVLNACLGARMLVQEDQHAFSGLASALINSGLPAVLAMQFPISEEAASRFSLAFYDSLGQNYPVDKAVDIARKEMENQAEDRPSFEWATPILFLHSLNGRILDLQDKTPKPKRIVLFSFRDIRKEFLDRADLQIDLTSYFIGKKLRKEFDWNKDIRDLLVNRLGPDLLDGTPYDLDFASLGSIAFTAGYMFHQKRSNRVRYLQLTNDGPVPWLFDSKVPPKASKWKHIKVRSRRFSWVSTREPIRNFPWDPKSKDIAAAVSITNDTLEGVVRYLERRDLDPPTVSQLILAELKCGSSDAAVQNGGHAAQLANDLCRTMLRLTSRKGVRTLHLFISAPNAFLFLLGQLSRKFSDIQLYEYGLGERSLYEPSIRLIQTLRPAKV